MTDIIYYINYWSVQCLGYKHLLQPVITTRAFCSITMCFLSQFSECRDFLVSVENIAAWVAERVLPFLVSPSEGGVTEQQRDLARQVVEVSRTCWIG